MYQGTKNKRNTEFSLTPIFAMEMALNYSDDGYEQGKMQQGPNNCITIIFLSTVRLTVNAVLLMSSEFCKCHRPNYSQYMIGRPNH